MVPVENPPHGGYSCSCFGGCCSDLTSRLSQGYECCNSSDLANSYCVGTASPSSHHHHHHHLHHQHRILEFKPMAEDESRTESSLNDAMASSSKDGREEGADGVDWLQLSIGGCSSGNNIERFDVEKVSHVSDNNSRLISQQLVNTVVPKRCDGLVELDLLPPSDDGFEQLRNPPSAGLVFHGPEYVTAKSRQLPPPNSMLPFNFFRQPGGTSSSFPHSNQEIQWPFRPNFIPPHITEGSSSATNYNLVPFFGSYFTRPVMVGADAGGSSSNIRVINTPRRPHSGIWFMLQASQNQAREPFLPQIPKSYLRIKDGKMTVGLLMKYLVNKLSLDSEFEIEIRCRGQELQPCLTMQHVRDNIWSRRGGDDDAAFFALLPPPDSPSDHLMVLHYGRRSALHDH